MERLVNLQQATLGRAFTQSNRSCTRCGALIPVTDFSQGQNQPPLFTPSNRVIMVYSILYISSPTRSRMAPLMGCRLSSIIKVHHGQPIKWTLIARVFVDLFRGLKGLFSLVHV